MSIPATSSVTTDPATAEQPASARVPMKSLGQEDFLKLLVAQMTSQDPLNPQKDTEFIAQMAQFSSLEQSKTMQGDMAKLQAYGLLGKTVDLQSNSDLADDFDLVVQGAVTAVQIEAGTPKLLVNGQQFDLSQVLSVGPGLDNSLTP